MSEQDITLSVHSYPLTYRQKEIKIIARWIEAGDSGKVVGLAGSGHATVLRFLCQHPEALTRHFTNPEQIVIPVPIDLNDLPAFDISTLYRTILRGFYESREKFPTLMQSSLAAIYQDHWHEQDAFVVQSALRELL